MRAVWIIPAERMKYPSEHRIPLGGRAIDVLRQAADLAPGSDVYIPFRHRQDADGFDDQQIDTRIGYRCCSARFQKFVPRLVRRHGATAGDRGGRVGAHGTRGRRRVLPIRPF